jgi:hypothetical protein
MRVRRAVCISLSRLLRSLLEVEDPPVEGVVDAAETVERAPALESERATAPRLKDTTPEDVLSSVAWEFPEDHEQIHDQHQEEQRPTEVEPVDRTAKATKNDDAENPVEIWMKFLEKGLPGEVKARDWKPHLGVLRRFWLRQYHRMIYKTAIKWIKKTEARGMVVTPEALVTTNAKEQQSEI